MVATNRTAASAWRRLERQRGQLAVGQNGDGVGVLEDVGDLAGGQPEVHRDRAGAQLLHREEGLDDL